MKRPLEYKGPGRKCPHCLKYWPIGMNRRLDMIRTDDVANDDSDDASDRISVEEEEEERREEQQPRPTRKRGINRTNNIDEGSLLLLFPLSTSPRTIEGNQICQ